MKLEERAWLFEAFLPLAKKRAKRFIWSGHRLKELYHVACVGLGLALRGYDPESHNNGLAAYAIPWIDGELKEFVTEGRSLVITRDGERNDGPPRKPSKRSRVPALVNYFGNVGIGDGEAKQDKSLHVEIGGDYAGDDVAVGGYWLADFADHRNEEVRGEYFSERLKTCRRGIDLRISWRAGWRWIGHAWLDRAAKLFYAEHQEFIKRGVGFLLRDRRTENKLTRPLLPYEEPSWTRRCKTKRKGCQCIGCRPTKDAPAYYAIAHEAKFRTYHRLDNAAYVSDEERNRQQDDWPEWKRKRQQRGPAPQWKLTLRTKLKLEHSRMFWPYDELKDYEIWSEPSYSRGLYESYFRPYRVPRLTATHRLPNKISAPYWSKVKLKKWVRFQHSPSLIGESDYGWKDVGFCLVTWAVLGHSHKLPKEMVGQEIVLHKQRKRDIRQYLKPDSPLVLLFWARQIIAWHYIRYWLPLEKQHEKGREKDKQHQT